MAKLVLIKENSKIIKSTKRKVISSKAYLGKNEQCFENIIDFEAVKNLKKNEIETLRSIVSIMIHEIVREDGGQKIINKLYDYLKNAKSREDLNKIGDLIKKAYEYILNSKICKTPYYNHSQDIRENTLKTFNNEIKNHFDALMSVIIKKIVICYYEKVLVLSGVNKIIKLKSLKNNGKHEKVLLEELGEKFDSNAVSNGIKDLSEKVVYELTDLIFERFQPHLCWEDCKNASPICCQKVADIIKKPIDTYDFITDGYQIFDSTGNVDKFIVTSCINYEKEEPKCKTKF